MCHATGISGGKELPDSATGSQLCLAARPRSNISTSAQRRVSVALWLRSKFRFPRELAIGPYWAFFLPACSHPSEEKLPYIRNPENLRKTKAQFIIVPEPSTWTTVLSLSILPHSQVLLNTPRYPVLYCMVTSSLYFQI